MRSVFDATDQPFQSTDEVIERCHPRLDELVTASTDSLRRQPHAVAVRRVRSPDLPP